MDDELAVRRVEYGEEGFRSADAGSDPASLFRAWYADAAARASVPEPNAMSLATVAADGTPSSRMVLLKAVEGERAAFTWYTNLAGRKATEALSHGRAALCWWWPGSPGRQVRAVGRVEAVSREQAAAYFASRPPAARIGAAASTQSRALASREQLEARAAKVAEAGLELPETWGGLTLVADELEFWQGRAGRLHDRITFLRVAPDGTVASPAAVEAAGGESHVRSLATEVVDGRGTRWQRLRLAP